MPGVLIAARCLHYAATISLVGVFAFSCLVAAPALRRVGAESVALDLRRGLPVLAWASLALALVSGAGWLVAIAAEMSGRPLAAALARGDVGLVLTQTRFGTDWLLRLGLVVPLGLVLLGQRRTRGVAGAAGWIGLGLALVLLASLAWAGHGAATPGAPGDLHLAADILHLLAAGMWLGTLAPLALLLTAARQAGEAGGAIIARLAVARFSALAIGAVAVLLGSGLVNTWFLAGTVPALVGTAYGRLLLSKIALFLLMLTVAAVNLLRLGPRLAGPAAMRSLGPLRRNALVEAAIGLGVLAIVGVLGILPPGLHTEPGWPFPFRLNFAALAGGAKVLLAILAALCILCAIALVAAAAAGRTRRSTACAGGLVLCLLAGFGLLRPVAEPATPTSFYAPAEPYNPASIAAGAAVYAANCALCHGASGKGDGPAAAGLPIRPADLTEPHLFAHSPGDLFWWVSHGRGGVMPGFASVLTPSRRWDVINFVLARAAGDLVRQVGPNISTAAAYPVPDFAFETGGMQRTLRQTLKKGPVLLVLFAPPAPAARLRQLKAAEPRLKTAGLRIIAVGLSPPARKAAESEAPPPFVVGAAPEAVAALSLFRISGDGRETELMLDRNGNVRARWTASAPGGLAPPAALIADAEAAGRSAVAAPSHAGHH